jgi:CO/xanthine dehydrogenase Mo-binding subunit
MAEIAAEPVNPAAANHAPLGVAEASGGPTVAAIGNDVAHALGARIRDLPLTRERIMTALLKV